MKIVNEKEFTDEVKEGVVLVDFFATWCMPCRMMAQILEEVDEQMKDQVKIIKVDVDESPNISRNFGLYHDISNRVMQKLLNYTPDIEQYSIDEAFIERAAELYHSTNVKLLALYIRRMHG